MRTYSENDEYPEKFGRGGCIDSSLHPPWICSGHQHCWGNGEMQNNDNTAIAGLYPKTMDCLQTEEVNCLPHAVCYDSVCLMPLIRINMFLFSDGDDTANRTEYDKDYDGSPAGLLGCIPRRLYWPCSLDGMTQYQAKINGPYLDTLPRMTLNDGSRWDVRISVTPPATHAGRGPSLALIGHRASVGGSAAPTDWPCALSPVDNPPGGIWIGFIRSTVKHRQSIVAVSVTGSLVSPTLFSRRDANCICRPSIFRANCDTDWSLPLLDHTEGGAMDADGFSMVDNRAGVTFGVELYVPWDAPEMVIDLSSTGTVPLRNVPDVFGMSGRRDSATESRILQGRDARSVRVLVPDCRGLDQNFHDVTVVDMGDLPECDFCSTMIRCDMYRHVARCHLDPAQLWRCPVSWCTVWKGAPQDLMDHVRGAHKVPEEVQNIKLEMLIPPWTVTRKVYTESLTSDHSGTFYCSVISACRWHITTGCTRGASPMLHFAKTTCHSCTLYCPCLRLR